jgi:hypothetical protein
MLSGLHLHSNEFVLVVVDNEVGVHSVDIGSERDAPGRGADGLEPAFAE